ncbi:murein L,D-transpeptidase catalytic domain family protein [Chryseobacterium indologenes]|uniref:murein L,D-transpeptidase catalytic domain-containing protein n=1 Tax=Chryseobacterium TaxID=59732 RepID=UPI001623F46C|nr:MULTISPECIES: murein L,D-transpeptidase catalytic domain family protein [Chryseobacterium]MDM1555342.1 murein L,D-transpeptidase catalytic domain family protein [Chryseobacterium indologenes]WET49903.1 murein L,D-transpeptidase catalytic domain family protein [Chryseobacterium indologenes]
MMKHFIFLFILLVSCSKAESQQAEAWGIPQSRISEIKNFIKDKDYNQDLAIFINFKIPSGKYRYFIYDLRNNKIVQKAIVAHGSGSVISGSNALKFSNIEGSYQSSLGKYAIGGSYMGQFGKAYRLKGLDSTNDNAIQRAIVLHSFSSVPDVESERPTCLSLGCPMLSINAFKETAKYIDKSEKPIILYTFY